MRVHAVLFAYANTRSLERAIRSLLTLQGLLKQITIFQRSSSGSPDVQRILSVPGIHVAVHAMESSAGDFPEFNTNELAHDDFYLFMHDEDFLAARALAFNQPLHDGIQVISCPTSTRQPSYIRPLAIRCESFHKRCKGLGHLLQTDSEAALAAHLAQFTDDEILTLDTPLLMQTRRLNGHAHAQRVAYLHELSRPRAELQLATSQSTVGVMLSVYNASQWIEMALSSLASQRVPANQVLVIDDGSTDDSSSRIRAWLHRLPNAVLIETQNQGKARAFNTLLPHVNTDFVLELDADDWLDPHAIGHIKYLLTGIPEHSPLVYGNFRTWRKRTSGDYELFGIHAGHQISSPHELLSYALPLGPRVYRTSSLRAAGGFAVPSFADGRLYEDVLTIRNLMQRGDIVYRDFTVYNTVQHRRSITKQHQGQWAHFVHLYRAHFIDSPRHPQ